MRAIPRRKPELIGENKRIKCRIPPSVEGYGRRLSGGYLYSPGKAK
jgi:hypothetical protein